MGAVAFATPPTASGVGEGEGVTTSAGGPLGGGMLGEAVGGSGLGEAEAEAEGGRAATAALHVHVASAFTRYDHCFCVMILCII